MDARSLPPTVMITRGDHVARVLWEAVLELTAVPHQIVGARAPLGARPEVVRLHHEGGAFDQVDPLPDLPGAVEPEPIDERLGEQRAVVVGRQRGGRADGDGVAEEHDALDAEDVLVVGPVAVGADGRAEQCRSRASGLWDRP